MKIFLASLLVATSLSNVVYAKTGDGLTFDLKTNSKKPAEIEADKMDYNSRDKVVIASGNVEVIQGNVLLFSDKITYDQNNNTVYAEGNISLKEPDGNVFFADKVELKDDLKQGVIDNLKIRFSDGSRMWASKAKRESELISKAENLRYTPCKICINGKEIKPLWQIRAEKAEIDEGEQKIIYENAYFDIKGIPVLYTPYISHPTPDADKKSGFLVPEYSNDNIFGTRVKVPYYFNIDTNMDATIAPIYTSEEGAILEGEFRHKLKSGQYEFKGSITNPDRRDDNGNPTNGRDLRGHIEGFGDFKVNENWSWGFNAKRSSDDTYLERYNYGYEDTLTSKIYTTAIDNRNYIYSEAISFQGLQADDDPDTTPLILPSVSMHYESDPAKNGSHFTYDANILSLFRDEGVSSKRILIEGGWNLPYISKSGHMLEFSTSLRADGYFVDNVPSNNNNVVQNVDGFTSRFIPEVQLSWKYPLNKKTKNNNIYLEPIANFIASPYESESTRIPNEDSQDVEFSDENVFDANHFTGYDKVETGPRANYGLRGRLDNIKYGSLDFILGQSYRTRRNNNFNETTGLDDYFSDFVGRIGYRTEKYFDISYRYRIDKDDFSFNRNAVTAALDIDPVYFQLDYLALNDSFDQTLQTPQNRKRELIIANANIDLTDRFSVNGRLHSDLQTRQLIETRLGALYLGDCVDLRMNWSKEFTEDRDIRPNNTFSFQISLKNLSY